MPKKIFLSHLFDWGRLISVLVQKSDDVLGHTYAEIENCKGCTNFQAALYNATKIAKNRFY